MPPPPGTVTRRVAPLAALTALSLVVAMPLGLGPAGAVAGAPRVAGAAALPPIVDDARLEAAVLRARERFLARHEFRRFDVTVLARRADGAWARGAHGGDRLAYPASCVKLAYLVGAVHWCAAQGREPDCLDADVRPMIVESDNVATGRVVDAITGTPNVEVAAAAGFAEWLERRRYTERLLESRGLLGGMRVLNKTWPTNSGEEPAGFEKVSIGIAGRNMMSADASARLMLAIVTGALEPQATGYMRALLAREFWGGHGTFGRGLPPGTRYEAKTGNAYDTQEEIAWFRLPDGREFVVAAFSDSWDQSQPLPHDVGHFGDFVEELLAALPHGDALPWVARVPASAATARGEWRAESLPGAYVQGGQSLTSIVTQPAGDSANAATLEWRVRVPRAGRYELAVWYPPREGATSAAAWEIESGDGTRTVVRYDQTVWSRRWLPLGRFLSRGTEIVVRLRAEAPGVLVADALRVAAIPDSGGGEAAPESAERASAQNP